MASINAGTTYDWSALVQHMTARDWFCAFDGEHGVNTNRRYFFLCKKFTYKSIIKLYFAGVALKIFLGMKTSFMCFIYNFIFV